MGVGCVGIGLGEPPGGSAAGAAEQGTQQQRQPGGWICTPMRILVPCVCGVGGCCGNGGSAASAGASAGASTSSCTSMGSGAGAAAADPSAGRQSGMKGVMASSSCAMLPQFQPVSLPVMASCHSREHVNSQVIALVFLFRRKPGRCRPVTASTEPVWRPRPIAATFTARGCVPQVRLHCECGRGVS